MLGVLITIIVASSSSDDDDVASKLVSFVIICRINNVSLFFMLFIYIFYTIQKRLCEYKCQNLVQ